MNGDDGNLLSLGDLAKELNLPDSMAVSTMKSRLLAFHKGTKNTDEYREFENMVESWFVKSGRAKFFKSAHLEELQELLSILPHRKRKDSDGKVGCQETNVKYSSRGDSESKESLRPFAGMCGIEFVRFVTKYLDTLLSNAIKEHQVTGAKSDAWDEFYKVKDVLVQQIKREQELLEAAQKFIETQQLLAEVVEKSLSKNIGC